MLHAILESVDFELQAVWHIILATSLRASHAASGTKKSGNKATGIH